jgi:hypothetical protein
MRTKLFAVVAVGLMVFAAGPGLATAEETGAGNLAVSVTQADDGSATVTVTANESGVADASVVVEAQNVSYEGEGSNYTTDENGTVGLPAPEENVTIDVTATVDNRSASTTATLRAVNESDEENETFGQRVSSRVHIIKGDLADGGRLGPSLAAWVVSNNPGNAPDHAGPPAFLTDDNETDNNETENSTADEQGPPWADDEEDDKRGPPDHANDDDADEDDEEDTEDDVDEEDEEAEEDDEGGPPEHAGPPR